MAYMANDWDDDDDFDTEDRPSRDDSSAIRSARKAEREKDKALKAVQEELAKVKGQLRERAIGDAIKEKNLNPKIAALVPKDLDSDGVAAFIADYADVFGVPAATAETPDNPEGDQPADPAIAALDRIGQAAGSIQPLNGTPDQMEARIKNAQSVEELNMLLHGNSTGMVAF